MKESKVLLIYISIVFFACSKEKGNINAGNTITDPCDTLAVTYANTIKPIIESNCTNNCHKPRTVGDGDFTTYQGVKGKVDNGSFKTRVIDQGNMPPGGPLPADELQKIQCWLNQGAPNN